MTVLRTDIEKALEEIISHEEGMRFQGVAVTLGKQVRPGLIACERKKDLGLDAYESASLAPDGIGRGLASSITATLAKVKDDAAKAKKNFPDLRVLIFATPQKVTNQTGQQWRKAIFDEFGLELILMPREHVIASLMEPNLDVIKPVRMAIRRQVIVSR